MFEPRVLLDRVVQSVTAWWPAEAWSRGLSPADPAVSLVENHLVRTDVSYPKKRLLGVAGRVVLRFADGVGRWAEPLLLAGIVGVGKARNMGQGRYTVVGCDLPCGWPPRPARTILERAASAENLEQARVQAGTTPGVDGESPEVFLDSLTLEMPNPREWTADDPILVRKGFLHLVQRSQENAVEHDDRNQSCDVARIASVAS